MFSPSNDSKSAGPTQSPQCLDSPALVAWAITVSRRLGRTNPGCELAGVLLFLDRLDWRQNWLSPIAPECRAIQALLNKCFASISLLRPQYVNLEQRTFTSALSCQWLRIRDISCVPARRTVPKFRLFFQILPVILPEIGCFWPNSAGHMKLPTKTLQYRSVFKLRFRRTDVTALQPCLRDSDAFRERAARHITNETILHITAQRVSLNSAEYGTSTRRLLLRLTTPSNSHRLAPTARCRLSKQDGHSDANTPRGPTNSFSGARNCPRIPLVRVRPCICFNGVRPSVRFCAKFLNKKSVCPSYGTHRFLIFLKFWLGIRASGKK